MAYIQELRMGLFAVDGGLRHGFCLCVRHEVVLTVSRGVIR